ncbi:MAG: ethanolamine utilization protein EutJ [Bacillota bacterium]|nr:ethanolamine utilization protein EutJ [Bacillota bacterium]
MNWQKDIDRIHKLNSLINNPIKQLTNNELKVGVDLGTAAIALVVVDCQNEPVAAALEWASVLKDGLVVDYLGAVDIVKRLKEEVEANLNTSLDYSATAIPPGTSGNNAAVCGHILEAAGLSLTNLLDEPTAAASALSIEDGIVVDIGGGTTGISVLQEGTVIYTADEPTGGTHLTLVLAGNRGISFEDAEAYKRNEENHNLILPVVTPVIEKMAHIVKQHIEPYQADRIYLVGGATTIAGFEKIFSRYLGKEVIKPDYPMLVTPLGIALNGK